MQQLIRYCLKQMAIGFALAAVFVAMLLWFDIAHLWQMIRMSDLGWLAILVLWLSNGLIFGAVQFVLATMGSDDDDDDSPHGGHRDRHDEAAMIPIRVIADTGRNRQRH